MILRPTRRDEPIGESWLGTPVYDSLRILATSYEDANGNTVELPEIELQSALLVVTQAKNIVRTQMVGRNGTVKEYIADGDFEVSVEGAITGPDLVFPEDAVRDLHEVLRAPIALEVVSRHLNALDITRLVVVQYSFPQEQARFSSPRYQFSCLSDKPVELVIDEEADV